MTVLALAAWRAGLVGGWMPLSTIAGVAGTIAVGHQDHFATGVASALLIVGPIGYLGARVLVAAVRAPVLAPPVGRELGESMGTAARADAQPS